MTSAEFFQLFTYPANWDIRLNLFFILVAILYLLITGPFAFLIKGSEPVSWQTKMAFMCGWIVYFLAMGSPLSLLAHELFSMHMLQMSLLYILMPPLLLLGMPAWFFRPLLRIRWLRKIGRFWTRPLVILFVFNGLISLYHIPVIFDAIMSQMAYHTLSHIVLLLAALCMWWPVICPVPEVDRVKPLHKLAFIFANGVLLTPACALIMFSDQVLFASYAEMSHIVPIFSPHDDQQLGGVIMKIMQELVYITAIGLIFVQWIRQQRLQDEADLEAMKANRQKENQANDQVLTNPVSPVK